MTPLCIVGSPRTVLTATGAKLLIVGRNRGLKPFKVCLARTRCNIRQHWNLFNMCLLFQSKFAKFSPIQFNSILFCLTILSVPFWFSVSFSLPYLFLCHLPPLFFYSVILSFFFFFLFYYFLFSLSALFCSTLCSVPFYYSLFTFIVHIFLSFFIIIWFLLFYSAFLCSLLC